MQDVQETSVLLEQQLKVKQDTLGSLKLDTYA